MKVYVSAPYTQGDTVVNVRRAIEAGDRLLEMGHFPFVPHLTHFWHFVSPKSWETWLEIDKAFLPDCDCVLRLDGASKGADLEVEYAKKLGKPVFYKLEDVKWKFTI